MARMRISVVVLTCVLLLGVLGSPAHAALEIVDLGIEGRAVAINDREQVVVNSLVGQVLLWQNGQMTALGDLGGGRSEAEGMNNRGMIVGASRTSEGHMHAFLWHKGIMQDLGTLGGRYSRAMAINGRGQIVGVSETVSGGREAFLWEGGVMTGLGADGGISEAVDINDRGDIVGSVTGGDGAEAARQAVLWTREGRALTFAYLPLLQSRPWASTWATAINSRGDVLGGWEIVWPLGGDPVLGPPRGDRVAPTDINNRGLATAYWEDEAFPAVPMIWDTRLGAAQESVTRLPRGSQAYATYPTAINNHGAVAGHGTTFVDPLTPRAVIWR